ncbi:MAG: hypothetical protein KGL62_12490 [Bradyrhizobium sp.]|uniref:hypothetical protein n=1 Tax=Bradyrhizobium sp. TaxID=376 RepID=UPI0023A64FF4|nr:hypothetical protein [Bradyrhizobium sp.]MDE2603169.1 hypothetical protein [Bradyrhizobium sp.]
MQLKKSFRVSIYAAFAVLSLSGAVWFLANWQKDLSTGEIWQQVAANMLMIHGGTAMLALLLIGALIPVHLLRGWRSRRNRVSGAVVVTINTVLIATAFGLYYLGSEALRPWISWIHLAAGCSVVLLLPVHIWLGRRESKAKRDASANTLASVSHQPALSIVRIQESPVKNSDRMTGKRDKRARS